MEEVELLVLLLGYYIILGLNIPEFKCDLLSKRVNSPINSLILANENRLSRLYRTKLVIYITVLMYIPKADFF